MEPVRFGIVGAGQIARYVAWVFREDPALRAVAVCDVRREAAEEVARLSGAPRTTEDVSQLLALPEVEAVYIATPPYLHRPMVLDALAAEKHVLCEKPFMLSAPEVREILAVTERKPHIKVGCCSCRFQDADTARRARQMVEKGDLGPVYRAFFLAVSDPAAPGAALPPWRNDPKKNGGGIAYDWGVYDLDWLQFVLADRMKPVTLFATMDDYFSLTEERRPPAPDVDGRFSAEILCQDGLSVHWERRAGEHGPAYHRVYLRGRKAGLDLSMTAEGAHTGLVRHAYRGVDALATEKMPEATPDWRGTLVYPIRDLAGAVREDRPAASPPHRQLGIHAILDALYASARFRVAVPVNA
ncbi:MAG: Gfo/Idh/MocA family oxidoreductase [Planctomycetes bacterium]|nr:Gfo/Idh/MocA family oxidoreductase [Planctomycetota bacterium]